MKIYLVGGAVRDMLLNRPIKDKDWVVVGSTPKQMLDRGYTQVGADFPVFIHPETKEEYALARTERKISKGYHGFETKCNSKITLEEDLRRRDLTINAIAYDPKTKQYIDPYGGINDLRNGTIKHVSEAFADDPVRILRTARFQARYGHHFHIDHNTLLFMLQLVGAGELDYLTEERVWLEVEKAMMENNPELFFLTLQQCNAYGRLFPEMKQVFNLSMPGTITLKKAVMREANITERLICFLYDQPKAVEMLQRLKATNHITRMINAFQILYESLHTPLTASHAIHIFEETGAFRQPHEFKFLLHVAQKFESVHSNAGIIDSIFNPVLNIGFQDLTLAEQNNLQGADIGAAIRRRRIFEASKVLRW